MGRWLKALGLGGSEGRSRSSGARVPNSQRVSRIRETMRWRGFDLSAYTDEEVATAAGLLGPSISPEGETTEESRQALSDLLLQRRLDPEAVPPHIPAPAGTDEEPPAPEPEATEAPEEPARAETHPPETVADPEPESAATAAAPAPTPARPGEVATTLERLKHIFGVHTWHLVAAGEDEAHVLRCYGCHRERPASPVATPLEFPQFDDDDNDGDDDRPDMRETNPFRERDSGQYSERRETRTGPSSAPRPTESSDSGTPGEAFRMFVRAPWWVKFVAVFVVLQVAAFVVRLFASAA